MGNVRRPLSGDVWQDISPFRNSAFSFFTIDLGFSRSPDTEDAILDVASYGRQIGRASEALLALIESDPARTFTKEQQAAIEDFKSLMREVSRAKDEAKTRPKPQSAWAKWFGG